MNTKEIIMEVGIMLTIGNEIASFDEQLATLVEIGVKRTFITARHPRHAEVMQKILDAGLICDNYHASVRGEKNGVVFEMKHFRFDGIEGDYMLELLLENIDNCAKYGIPVLVVHGAGGKPEEEWPDVYYQRTRKLLDHAKKKGVTIAFENLGNAQNLFQIFEKFPEASFCWDCGHQNCNSPETRYMQTLGNKVVALHIHDNSCEYRKDLHMIPYDSKIDFDEVAYDIAKSGYDGTMMLEIMYGREGSVGGGYADRMSYKEYATRARDAANRIIERVEFFKKELENK